MTTIIGVRARNPENGMYYVLLASDSRNSLGNTPVSDDESKIISPKHSNYALGSSGKNLFIYFKNDEEAEKLLLKGGIFSQTELEGKLWHIASVLKQNELSNDYLIAFQGKHEALLFSYSLGQRLHLVETNAVIGSGLTHIGKSVHEQLQKYKLMTGDIKITPKELQEILLHELKEAAKKDRGTGGKAQFVLLTHKSISVISDNIPLKFISKALNEDDIPGQHPKYRDID